MRGEYEMSAENSSLTFEDVELLANNGSAYAQGYLGFLHCTGKRGAPQDCDKGLEWLKKAVEQDDKSAQLALATLHHRGDRIPQDYKEAFKWYKKAAENGVRMAQYYLAGMYRRGDGTSKDPQKDFYWLKKAAEQGYENAQILLAMKYLKGDGTEKDEDGYVQWLLKSAEHGDGETMFLIALNYSMGRNGFPHDKKEAEKWLKRSAEQGYEDAQGATVI